jgi:two-component system cell cycle sensor histidine kinase/response regulator CckA
MAPQESITVLLVDDEESASSFMRNSLQRHGYTVLCANCGEEGLRCFAERQDEIDLVISDIIMPGISGYVMIETIRAMRPELSVLFVSGTNQPMPPWAAETCGVLRKPFMVREFIAAVEDCLQCARKPAA